MACCYISKGECMNYIYLNALWNHIVHKTPQKSLSAPKFLYLNFLFLHCGYSQLPDRE